MSTAAAAPSVHLQTRGHVPPAELDYAGKKIAMALDAAQAPVLFVRAKLTALSEPAIEAPAIVQVNVNLNGRPVRAQAARSTFHEAIDEVQDRLRYRLRRADRDWEAVRGGLSGHDAQPGRSSSAPAAGPGRTPVPEGERQVWRHKAYTLGRITVDDAALEMDILGYQFHLFAEKGKPLVPSKLSRPIGRLTTVVHPLVTQYPRMAGVVRKWSPEHMMHTPQEAFPDARISTDVPLDILMFVERFNASHVSLQETEESWMVSRLIGNFYAEMSLHSREVVVAMGTTGLLPIETFFNDKREVFERAVAGKPTYLLRVPASFPADQASDVIVEHLQKAMADAGVA